MEKETDTSKSPELRLTNAWVANYCGDSVCMNRRLEAAISVLFGDKTHIEIAEVVERARAERKEAGRE